MFDIIFSHESTTIKRANIAPEIVFDCGQAFRFNPYKNGYLGIACGKPLFVCKNGEDLILSPCSEVDFISIWERYFDLALNYEDILMPYHDDDIVNTAIASCPGMRLLNQEPFETIITFIISANNNIMRIKKIVEAISALAGEQIEYDGVLLHSFPAPHKLAALNVEQLAACGAGYRAPYIKKTSEAIAEGRFDLNDVGRQPYEEARKMLMLLPGVGPKVADCILLFSYDMKNAFPKDVWIARVLKELYGFEPKNDREMVEFAEKRFGRYGGIIQQYLFHYARISGKI